MFLLINTIWIRNLEMEIKNVIPCPLFQIGTLTMDSPKHTLRFFCTILWKNLSEVFGQPNIVDYKYNMLWIFAVKIELKEKYKIGVSFSGRQNYTNFKVILHFLFFFFLLFKDYIANSGTHRKPGMACTQCPTAISEDPSSLKQWVKIVLLSGLWEN